MENKPLFSIIVPVYNAERTLVRCVESILSQSYTSYELILVNDGSEDLSLDICNDYLRKDQRIVVINQANEGVSAARNAALDIAKGDYIIFCDSDDCLAPNCLSDFEKYRGADLVVGGYVDTFDGKVALLQYSKYTNDSICEFLSKYLESMHLRTPWAKCFRRMIIKNNQIRFDPRLSFGEDTIFVYTYLLYIRLIVSLDSVVYYYEGMGDQLIEKYYRRVDTLSSLLRAQVDILDRLSTCWHFTFPDNFNIGWLYWQMILKYILTESTPNYMYVKQILSIDGRVINVFNWESRCISTAKLIARCLPTVVLKWYFTIMKSVRPQIFNI